MVTAWRETKAMLWHFPSVAVHGPPFQHVQTWHFNFFLKNRCPLFRQSHHVAAPAIVCSLFSMLLSNHHLPPLLPLQLHHCCFRSRSSTSDKWTRQAELTSPQLYSLLCPTLSGGITYIAFPAFALFLHWATLKSSLGGLSVVGTGGSRQSRSILIKAPTA